MNEKLVSICSITFNHEKYIAQAIESVLMQNTNFNYELVVGEDCSTDKTKDIIIQYYIQYPEKIKLILNKKNIGMIGNFTQTLKACKGKYIAILEGDDYWTDPLKLQKQVDFLEDHPDFAICFHNARKLFQETGDDSSLFFTNPKKDVFTLSDIIKDNFIPTLTCVFRNKLFKEFPDWYYDAFPGDWPLHILNAQYGKIKYIDEIMATYRIHKGGICADSSPTEIYERSVKTLESIEKGNEIKHKKIVAYTISKLYFELSRLYLKEKDYGKAKIAISICLKKYQYSLKQTLKTILLLINIYIKIKR